MTGTSLPPGVTAVLRHLAKGPATGYEICQAVPLTGDTVTRALARLVADGWATVTETRGGSWGPRRTYTLTRAGRDIAGRTDTTEA